LGLARTVQDVPFQVSTRVCCGLVLVAVEKPTASHHVVETHDTEMSQFVEAPTFGLVSTVHDVPFHDSMRVRWTLPAVV